MFAHDASWIFILSLGSLASCAADPGACTSEKIFARAVAEECGPLDAQSPTLDWTALTGEIFEPWLPWPWCHGMATVYIDMGYLWICWDVMLRCWRYNIYIYTHNMNYIVI